jgi:hypothetical protein
MIAIAQQPTPTRLVGLASYGLALCACGIAWLSARQSLRTARMAACLFAVEFFLFLDMAFNWRWALNGVLVGEARQHRFYEGRREPQAVLVLLLLVLLLAALVRVVRRYRKDFGAALAVTGVAISSTSWCVEVISLHQVDAVLYHVLGPVKVVSLVWIFGCLLTAIGMLLSACQANTNRRISPL